MNKPTNPKAFFKNAKFIKATGSYLGGGGNGGDICVEVAKKDGYVGVRDSKNPTGPVLSYTTQEWDVFVAGVKNGEFD